MNIDQAKTIPISLILDKLNQFPQKTSGNKQCYFSPFRNEKTPSLWVSVKDNLWRDFGDFKWQGGDGIHLVRAWLDYTNESYAVADALRWLSRMTGFIPTIKPVVDSDETPPQKNLTLKETKEIDNRYLIDYADSRGIPKSVLVKYYKQAVIFNKVSQKYFNALCIKNDWKGYELRTAYFKGCIGKKYITFIRGTDPNRKGINIFEGGFDYLSVITQREGKPFEDDSIILHSLANLRKASAYLEQYGYTYAYTWMDNDEPGKAAVISWTDFCKNEPGLIHVPKNELYAPYKDVNAAHIARLGL